MSQHTHGPTTGADNRKPFESAPGARAVYDARPSATRGRGSRGPRAAAVHAASTDGAAAPSAPTRGGTSALDPGAIARVLRVMADEVERDPALARRVAEATDESRGHMRDTETFAAESHAENKPKGRSKPPAVGAKPFMARIVSGAGSELGTGIPDPFKLRARLGREGLRAALDDLRLGTLRAMVREYYLDGTGRSPLHNDAARLRQLIMDASDARV